MLGLAIEVHALALPAALAELRRIAAARAEAVAGVPINQRAGAAISGEIARRERGHGAPQAGVGGAGVALVGRGDGGEAGAAGIVEAEEDELVLFARIGKGAPDKRAIIADDGIEAIEPEEAGAPVHQFGQLALIGADVVGAIEHGAGEGNRGIGTIEHGVQAAFFMAEISVSTDLGNSSPRGRP